MNMAAASLLPDSKIFGDLNIDQLSDTSRQMPEGVMADLEIPGYTWLYLTVPDASTPGRNLTFTAGGTDRPRASGAPSEDQAWQQAGGERDGHWETESQRFVAEKEKFKANTAKEVPFKLPSILMTNARSLLSKMQDLKDRIKNDKDIKSCELMCFTETWLKEPPSDGIKGYRQKHCPRDPERTGKRWGGGLGVLIKNGVKAQVISDRQTPNYQRMVFIYETENHPAGAPPLIFMLVYIQPAVKRPETRRKIERHYCKALERSNEGPVFILGDFNWCKLKNIRSVKQYVTCPTRRNKILDKCYGNIPQAYTSQCKAPLRSSNKLSDHNVILLTPEKKKCTNPQW